MLANNFRRHKNVVVGLGEISFRLAKEPKAFSGDFDDAFSKNDRFGWPGWAGLILMLVVALILMPSSTVAIPGIPSGVLWSTFAFGP